MNAPDPRTYAISHDVLELVPESIVREDCVLAARADEWTVTLFCPDDMRFGLRERERLQAILHRSLEWWPAPRQVVHEAITRHYGELPILVQNCDVNFRYRCPQFWEKLRETDDANVRLCDLCQRSVHRAADANEAELLARQGMCVAYSHDEYCDTLGLIELD